MAEIEVGYLDNEHHTYHCWNNQLTKKFISVEG